MDGARQVGLLLFAIGGDDKTLFLVGACGACIACALLPLLVVPDEDFDEESTLNELLNEVAVVGEAHQSVPSSVKTNDGCN